MFPEALLVAKEKELEKRTLTNLYNQQPTWLDLVHRNLDEEILERLLALNLERAAGYA